MNRRIFGSMIFAIVLAACQPQLPFADDGGTRSTADPASTTPAAERAEPASASEAADVDLQALARPPQRGEDTVCRAFARAIASAALEHPTDPAAFVGALQDEFIGGKDNPFDMKRGLQEGRWNKRYFYAGHGGFRPEYDDAQRYPGGGNHQPGHFISVLSIAQQFGEEQARIAIAVAGDYDPGDEDDLRLSNVAIPLGAGLTDGSVSPAEVAQRARELCRS
jgi:hypothetical protein